MLTPPKVHTGARLEDVLASVFECPDETNKKSFTACAVHVTHTMLSSHTNNIIGTVEVAFVHRRLHVRCHGWSDDGQDSGFVQRDLHHVSSTNDGGGSGAFISYARFGLAVNHNENDTKYFYVYVGGGPHNNGDYDFQFQHPACGNLAARKNPGGTKFTFSNTRTATASIDLGAITDFLFPLQGTASPARRQQLTAADRKSEAKQARDQQFQLQFEQFPEDWNPQDDDEEAPMEQDTEQPAPAPAKRKCNDDDDDEEFS